MYIKQNGSTEGCSKLKRSVDMTSSGKNGLNIRTNASPKWTPKTVCNKKKSKFSLLIRIKQYLPKNARILYFNAFILSIIHYCIKVNGHAPKTNLKRIHKLQKRGARIILDSPPDWSSLPLFATLKWLTVSGRIQYHNAILVYKS